MVRNELKYASQIRRKETVPAEYKTPKRDAAADWIDEHIVRAGRYEETSMAQMSEESGWSRQHIANTLEHYYEPTEENELRIGGVDIDLLLQVYREGYKDGLADAQSADPDEPRGFENVVKDLQ